MMGKGSGYAQNAYQKANSIGGPSRKELQFASRLMIFKHCYGMGILLRHHFQGIGEKFNDKMNIYLAN